MDNAFLSKLIEHGCSHTIGGILTIPPNPLENQNSTVSRLTKRRQHSTLTGKEVPAMYEIDKEQFGTFLSQLRRERGMTQKDLAERLYISDKAVSKWERGLSLPDIALLQPLAELFGVSITELLSGRRIQPEEPMAVRDVDALLSSALHLTEEERTIQREHRRTWGRRYVLALLAFALEVFLLRNAVPLFADEAVMLWLTPLFGAAFGSYFVFFCKEKLPPFYDQYRVNFYSDGVLRMNVPGVYFNNRNWPHIVDAVRTWSCAVMAGWVPLFVLVWQLQRAAPEAVFVITFITGMTSILGGLFVPIYVVGRKYE